MLTLVNTNRMAPPIAPVGLDYLAGAVRRARIDVDLLDLCLADDPGGALGHHFAERSAELVAVSFRNVDDCFWPGSAWFVPELESIVRRIRELSPAPIVVGGVGFSIFARRIVEQVGADFGVRGDGERALVELVHQLHTTRRFDLVEGLIWRDGEVLRSNPPAWPERLSVPTAREAVDNRAYFRLGGQIGVETKRGCSRHCAYCADPLAKGPTERLRSPVEVADEMESLLAQGIDVVHLCDSEFNLPIAHARDVCEEFIRRRLGDRLRWYTYMTVLPFDGPLARQMRRAGCVGINFTSDSAVPSLLTTYGQPHRKRDLIEAVRLCREQGIAVMLDLLLGGPGETPATLAATIDSVRWLAPDCAGAALGIRLYPGTPMHALLAARKPLDETHGIHRRYDGPIDLLRPNFYVSPELGDRPAALVRDLIDGDPLFFPPDDGSPSTPHAPDAGADYNYNENRALVDAIARGARGAYWDILRGLRDG